MSVLTAEEGEATAKLATEPAKFVQNTRGIGNARDGSGARDGSHLIDSGIRDAGLRVPTDIM